jgi:hypothetical protein
MAFTTEQYSALKAAIAQGALRVRYGDKEVEYRSLEEMLQTLRLMEKDLFPNKKGNGRSYASFSKGV